MKKVRVMIDVPEAEAHEIVKGLMAGGVYNFKVIELQHGDVRQIERTTMREITAPAPEPVMEAPKALTNGHAKEEKKRRVLAKRTPRAHAREVLLNWAKQKTRFLSGDAIAALRGEIHENAVRTAIYEASASGLLHKVGGSAKGGGWEYSFYAPKA